jgi:hypothetical protein
MAEGDDEKTVRQRLTEAVPELVKRTFYAGLGAVFTTEEGIRKLASEFHLPKDVANYLIASAASTKDELFRIVGHEIREFLQNMNLSQEVAKMLTTLSFEIKTEIRFVPNDEAVLGVKPDVKKKVAVKHNSRKADEKEKAPPPASEESAGDGLDEDDDEDPLDGPA